MASFARLEQRTYEWDRHVSGADWAAFAETTSDHQRLPAERRSGLLAGIREAIERIGEPIRVRGTTMASFAWRDPR